MRWIVTLAGGEGSDKWIDETSTVEAENIKEAVDKAIAYLDPDEELDINNIVGIDLE